MELDLVGAAMHNALRRGGQAGRHDALGLELLDVVERRPAHDGYFHNMIGLLTETIGNPTPSDDSVRARRSSCRAATCRARSRRSAWHFRQSIDYSVTANRAVLDLASRVPREPALQHLPDGQERDRARQPRQLDDRARATSSAVKARDRGRIGRGRQRRRCAAMAAPAAVRWAIRSVAVRRASADAKYYNDVLHAPEQARSARLHHSGRPAGLPRRRRSSSTRCVKTACTVHPRDGAVHGGRQAVSGRLATS